MTARADNFLECLQQVVSPRLQALGFVFDKSRTYRRFSEDGCKVEIVNFQLGQRRLEGRFTVNLGVLTRAQADGLDLKKAYPWQGSYQNRLGCVRPPRSERLKDAPFLGMFFGRHDKWWRFSAEREYRSRRLDEACDMIVEHGVPWLERYDG